MDSATECFCFRDGLEDGDIESPAERVDTLKREAESAAADGERFRAQDRERQAGFQILGVGMIPW